MKSFVITLLVFLATLASSDAAKLTGKKNNPPPFPPGPNTAYTVKAVKSKFDNIIHITHNARLDTPVTPADGEAFQQIARPCGVLSRFVTLRFINEGSSGRNGQSMEKKWFAIAAPASTATRSDTPIAFALVENHYEIVIDMGSSVRGIDTVNVYSWHSHTGKWHSLGAVALRVPCHL